MSTQVPPCTCSVDGITAPYALKALMHFPGCAYNLAMGSNCPLCYRPTNSLVSTLPGLVPVWQPATYHLRAAEGGEAVERSQTEVVWSQQSPVVSSRPAPLVSNTSASIVQSATKRALDHGSKGNSTDTFDIDFPLYDTGIVQKKSKYTRGSVSTPDGFLQGMNKEPRCTELKKLGAKFSTLQAKASDFFRIGFKEANQSMRNIEDLIKQVGAVKTVGEQEAKEKKEFLGEAKELEKLMRERKVQKEFLQEVFSNKRKALEYYDEFTSGKRELMSFKEECDSFVDHTDSIDNSHEEVWEACFKVKNDILLLKAKAERQDKSGNFEDVEEIENAS